jgi:alpha-galactosidase
MELHASGGGVCTPEDYAPIVSVLRQGVKVDYGAGGGRSSNGVLPFFNLDEGSRGLVLGVGWSGQWSAGFAADPAGNVRVRAGMSRTHLRLKPGESIRSPRILAIAWSGDSLRGNNMLRQLIYRHHTPLLAGKKPLPPVQCNTWFPVGDDGGRANEKNQIALLDAYQPLGLEYMVMDAGWYGDTPNWSANVGTWRPRKDTFPNGLKPVGDAARRTGIQFGMWFEFERVVPGTQIDREHPDWLIAIDEKGSRLLNLGLPAAQDYVIDMVGRFVEDVPLGYFRHDFNMDPLAYWQKADAADRVGITEIRYVEGLYRIWDELHRRYPALMMEGCASGGRRIDLESLSRCHTYWKSDLYGEIVANQGHTYGASLFLPGVYLNTPLFDLSEDP